MNPTNSANISFYAKEDDVNSSMASEDLAHQDQTTLEDEYSTHNSLRNDPDLWVDIDDLINDATYTEKQERVSNVVQDLRKIKESDQASTRPIHYSKITNRVKLEIMNSLKDLLSLSKKDLKQRNIKNRGDVIDDISKKYDVPIKTLWGWYYSIKKKPDIVDELEELCQSHEGRTGRGQLLRNKEPRITYPRSVEDKLVDWIYGCHEVGALITLSILRKKARDYISPHVSNFKASYKWAKKFLRRRGLSLRATTTKIKKVDPREKEAQELFLMHAKRLISDYRIHPKYVINVDETPIYWEYLPRKIIYKKGSKVIPSIKTGFEHKRSTLTLACTAWGDLLRPSVILRRKRPYTLGRQNQIKLLLQKSDNGWANSKTFIELLDKIIIPYVQGHQCLLLMDSFEGHICQDIRIYLKQHPYIHSLIIPGGATDTLQPLDMGINSVFKAYCKEAALNNINTKMEALYKDAQYANVEKKNMKLEFLAGRNTLFSLINVVDENDSMVILEKDLNRRASAQRIARIKITFEDIYEWIEHGYKKVCDRPSTILNCFYKAGLREDAYGIDVTTTDIPMFIDISLNLTELSDVSSSSGASEGEEEKTDANDVSDLEFYTATDLLEEEVEKERSMYEKRMGGLLSLDESDNQELINIRKATLKRKKEEEEFWSEAREAIRQNYQEKLTQYLTNI